MISSIECSTGVLIIENCEDIDTMRINEHIASHAYCGNFSLNDEKILRELYDGTFSERNCCGICANFAEDRSCYIESKRAIMPLTVFRGSNSHMDRIYDEFDKFVIASLLGKNIYDVITYGFGFNEARNNIWKSDYLLNGLYGMPSLMRALFRALVGTKIDCTGILSIDEENDTFPEIEPEYMDNRERTIIFPGLYSKETGSVSPVITPLINTEQTKRNTAEFEAAMPEFIVSDTIRMWRSADKKAGHIVHDSLYVRTDIAHRPIPMARMIDSLADMTCIDKMMEAYIAGVALEDIIM